MLTKSESTWTTESIEKAVWKIVAQQAVNKRDGVSPDVSWRVNGVDSLDLFAVLTACEHTFGIEIPDSDAIHLTTMRLLTEHIVQILATQYT